MAEQRIRQPVCRSIFKSGDSASKAQYTKKWIELINLLEKSKAYTSGKG